MVDKVKAKYVAVRKASLWQNEEKDSPSKPDFQGVEYSTATLDKYSKYVDGKKVIDYDAIPESEKTWISLWKNTDGSGKVVLKTTTSKKEGENESQQSNSSGDDLPF